MSEDTETTIKNIHSRMIAVGIDFEEHTTTIHQWLYFAGAQQQGFTSGVDHPPGCTNDANVYSTVISNNGLYAKNLAVIDKLLNLCNGAAMRAKMIPKQWDEAISNVQNDDYCVAYISKLFMVHPGFRDVTYYYKEWESYMEITTYIPAWKDSTQKHRVLLENVGLTLYKHNDKEKFSQAVRSLFEYITTTLTGE